MRLRLFLALVSAMAFVPTPASADFHLVSIREVFPGDAAQPDAEYVQFQAYTGGQNFIAGHSVTFRNAVGGTIATETFGADVADGRNQMTFVIATPSAEARFGGADEGMAANLLDPAGGAVCWEGLDCVSWGNFSGSLPSSAGSPATSGGIPDGMALRRTIASGCSTLLESSDDHDNSATDFSAVFPGPRPNSVAPTERACGSAGGGSAGPGGGKADDGPGRPETFLRSKPAKKTRDRTPTFRFASDEVYATFQCKLDSRPYRACSSPFTSKRLAFGRHVFRVRAHHHAVGLDPSPAIYRFKVVTKPPGEI